VIWVELEKLELAEGAPTQGINPYDESLTGNVTARFAPQQIAF